MYVVNWLFKKRFDYYVYLRMCEYGSLIYLILYVDAMLISLKNLHEITWLKTFLSKEFEIKDPRVVKKIMG